MASCPKSLHRMVKAPQLSSFPFRGKRDWMGYVARTCAVRCPWLVQVQGETRGLELK